MNSALLRTSSLATKGTESAFPDRRRRLAAPQALVRAYIATSGVAVMACTFQQGLYTGSTFHFLAQPPNRCCKPYQNGTSTRISTASRRMCGSRFQSKPQHVSTDSPRVSQATLHWSKAMSHPTVLAFLGLCVKISRAACAINVHQASDLLALIATSVL